MAKFSANLAAVTTLRELQAAGRPAAPDEQAVLARWASWGAIPEVFDEANEAWAARRSELRGLLTDEEWASAARTTINAHYTSAEVAEALWNAVRDLGFTGGRVLEPGCGSGNFIGLAPLAIDATGVELDPTTAAIAQLLYPSADIRCEGFERSRFPADHFDLTIGNVPFGKVVLHDPAANAGRHSMHNHFIIKSLQLTRPGGLVAVLTSRYTLDARNPAARRGIAATADLLGAVRLPEGSFRAAAGTDVVMDVLVLRRRHPDDAAWGTPWSTLAEITTPEGPVAINEYFAHRPTHVLGEVRAVHGQYSAQDVTVRATTARPLGQTLSDALASITAEARAAGRTWSPRIAEQRAAVAVVAPQPGSSLKEWSILVAEGGGFCQVVDGVPRRFEPTPGKDAGELAELLGLRDALRDLLDLQATTVGDDDTMATSRRLLNQRYDAYVRRHGPLNRFRLVRTGRRDPETGEETYRRLRPRMGGFDQDPDSSAVMALESFDPDTHTARKAAIFSRRVVAPRHRRLGAESAEDALALCLDEHARVDLQVISTLLGVDPTTARAELGELVWDDPASGELVTADSYLSGNVRTKLAAAEAAAADPRWQGNVEALRAVVPVDLGPAEIDARLGAPWIPATDVVAFGREVLGAQTLEVEHVPAHAMWSVTAAGWDRDTVAMISEWGTRRADAVSLLGWSLQQQTAAVYDYDDDHKRTLNPEETLAAREKQEALEERFRTWVWEEPTRARRLQTTYNERFNSTVVPAYSGRHLTVPGVSADFRPHPHQLDAVWRIVQEPNVLLAHVVGAGKTATMGMAAMELRRLGIVRKPALVVPNHMLDQFARELLQLYPQARILVATREQTTPQERKHFVARCATGDWDAVLITHSAFERIPVSPATAARFVRQQIAQYREDMAALPRDGKTVKRMERVILQEEERHHRLLNAERRDDGVSFEATGIDYLFCDEAHAHKNLRFPTHIQGVSGQGSQRAEDLHLKLSFLRERHGARVATLSTATPIANSIAEMFVMQSYLQPAALDAAGIASFDAWAATFGRSVTALELAPDGAGYRLMTRFARFANVPELLTMFRSVADVRTAEELNLPTPAITGGRAETVVVPRSDGLAQYVETLVRRAELVRNRSLTPDQDNMLRISGDGRRAALDLRLVGEEPDPTGGKIAAAASRIAAIEAATRHLRYVEADGSPEERPGALQLVFCDVSTPRAEWNAYDELRSRLVDLGIPAERIRFMHDAADDRAKAELFAAARSGRISVLIGSTEKMGVGTNVQRRAVALHHLDCPWRPADIEQREGRILRQGNQNAEVSVLRYVTERSFDVFLWQTVERKASFIHQVMRGGVDAREIDDIGEQALSFAEVKALATGDPLIMELAGVDNEVAKLERLARSHQQDRRRLEVRAADAVRRRQCLGDVVSACDAALVRHQDTRGDRFAMAVGDHRFAKRVDAGARLRLVLVQDLDRVGAGAAVTATVGELGGFPITARLRRDLGDARVELWLEGVPGRRVVMTSAELVTAEPVGLAQRLEHCAFGVEAVRQDALAGMGAAAAEAEQATARIDVPFDHAGRLARLRQRHDEITGLLMPTDEHDATADVAVQRPAPAPETGPTPPSAEPAADPPLATHASLHPADGDTGVGAPSADLPHLPDEGLEEPQTVRTLLDEINRELDAQAERDGEGRGRAMEDTTSHPRRGPTPASERPSRLAEELRPRIDPGRRHGIRGPGL